mgnify:CR=1 FL=1
MIKSRTITTEPVAASSRPSAPAWIVTFSSQTGFPLTITSLDLESLDRTVGSVRQVSQSSVEFTPAAGKQLFKASNTFAKIDEAIAFINDNPNGNGTAIFTNDGGAARRFQNEIEVGMIGINVPIPVPVAYYSFGGWKNSLFGDTKAHGVEGVHFFTRGKAITSRWLDPSHGGINLGFPQN